MKEVKIGILGFGTVGAGVVEGILKNGELMNNVGLGITMFLKGKMPMIPKNVSNRRAIRKMFERYQQKLAERKDG